MIGFLFFCFFGILVGFFAGLLPGVHPNQIYFLIISLGLFVETKTLIVFLASLATANIIFNYIPTLFLSLPDTNTVLNVLPGHKLVLKGKGLKALKINLISFLLAALLIFATSPLLFLITEKLQKFAKPFIPYFLGTLVIVTILVEKGERKVFALLLFLLSGVLGLVTLNGKGLKQDVAIFCILTGLFGIPNLLFVQKESIPKQDTSEDDVKLDVKLILLSLLCGTLSAFLPGAGESQIGLMVSLLVRTTEEESLSVLSSLNAANMLLTVIMLASTGKIRSGLAEALSLTSIQDFMLLFFGAVLFSAGISSLVCFLLGKKLLNFLEKVNYGNFSKIIIASLIILALISCGSWGLLLLITSTSIGVLPILLHVKRTNNMGFFILPTLLFYSKLDVLWI